MAHAARMTRPIIYAFSTLYVILALWSHAAAAADSSESKTSGGLTVYLGIVPAEILKDPPPHSAERPMHGRIPRGPHEYHVVAALFDTATGVRISDAAVTAQISGLGLSGSSKKLERMEIAGSTTYGAFFNLSGRDLYTVKLTIERSSSPRPLTFNFKYDHR